MGDSTGSDGVGGGGAAPPPPPPGDGGTNGTGVDGMIAPTTHAAAGQVVVSPGGGGGVGDGTTGPASSAIATGGARGDRRSRLVRERSRSIVAAFAVAPPPPPPLLPPAAAAASAAEPSPASSSSRPAAVAAATTAMTTKDDRPTASAAAGGEEEEEEEALPALFTSFCHRGLEVIFVAVNPPPRGGGSPSTAASCHLLAMHARTRVPFQKCRVSPPQLDVNPGTTTTTAFEIVQLTSHPASGCVYAADSVGNVHSFYPARSDPMVEAYGKFRWRRGTVARCREVFGYGGTDPRRSMPPPPSSSSGQGVADAADRRPSLCMESGEDGVEVSEVVPSIDGRENDGIIIEATQTTTTTTTEGGRGDVGRACFHRRKRGPSQRINSSSTPIGPVSGGVSPVSKAKTAPSSQGIYPLADDPPPLPATTVDEDASMASAGYGIMICASMTEKRVLIAHRDQLAIFDFSLPLPPAAASPPPFPRPPRGVNGERDAYREDDAPALERAPEALLLWTHKLRGCVINHASISGDGCAIALALLGEGVGVPYPFGVRTFVRDKDDGSGVASPFSAGGVASGADVVGAGSAGRNDAGVGGVGGGVEANKTVTNAGGKPPVHGRTGSSRVKPLPAHYSPPLPQKKSINHDGLLELELEDGTSATTTTPASRAAGGGCGGGDGIINLSKRGILYKPAQFLVHSAPVTRLAFRGYGTRTSSAYHNSTVWNEIEEGNDLLLTTCSADCSVRIFSQNSWRQLMQWNSPPKSRADWVRGISAANLGDLDSSPTSGNNGSNTTSDKDNSPKKRGTRGDDVADSSQHSSHSHQSQNVQHQQHTSDNSSMTADATGGINRSSLATTHSQPPTFSFNSHYVSGTQAGAWIAELTFRNTFPALRLSRLSYMKTGGDDALPAHFESVAAILPPGSIAEEVVLEEGEGMDECRIEVEGIWPAWDPWEPDLKGGNRGSGVAPDFNKGQFATDSRGGAPGKVSNQLGSTSPGGAGGTPTAAMSPRWLGEGYDLGGSHMPPSELRLTSSHSRSDCLAQIEMPLWGDKDFGAMEFGSPMRYVMMIPDQVRGDIRCHDDLPKASLEYESGSRLCARSSLDRRSIDMCWRKHGAVNFEEIPNDHSGFSTAVRIFQDFSLTPLPLLLPSLTLPGLSQSSTSFDKHAVSSLHWWPDENYGGPPRLVAATQGGSIIVYEMPPPWSALEPPMPEYDPFNDDADDISRGSSVDSDYMSEGEEYFSMGEGVDSESFSENTARSGSRAEYEVSILPHPDFGIGLRLESPAVGGMHAIVGSFKKHPLSGGRLPAERCGMIACGDELLAVNDVLLEGMKFEDAIGTVRQIGFDSYGTPLRMRFRKCRKKKKRLSLDLAGMRGSHASDSKEGLVHGENNGGGSVATVQVGADNEIQQGFGRIIAIVRDAMVVDNSLYHNCDFSPPAMLLLPWNFGKGAAVSSKMYGGAFILWAVPGNRTVKAARLEAVLDIDPENARFMEIGSISLDQDESAGAQTSAVKSISYISSTEKGWLVALHDCAGDVSLLFIETACASVSSDTPSCINAISASFRYYPNIFNSHGKSTDGKKHDPRDAFILKSFSLELFGAMKHCYEGCRTLTTWSAFPQAINRGSYDKGADQQPLEYNSVTISIDDIPLVSSDEAIIDFRWVASGFVDAFPWLVIFTQRSAFVYHRSGIQSNWHPIAIISYKEELLHMRPGAAINPYDAFPHLITALQCAVLSNDEHGKRMKCDWHPESILANICTDEEGAQLALKTYAHGLYSWLSQWMNPDVSQRPTWGVRHGALPSAPFRIVHGKTASYSADQDEKDYVGSSGGMISATALMSTSSNPANSTKDKPWLEENVLLSELQTALCPCRNTQGSDYQSKERNNVTHNRSQEFMVAMSSGKIRQENHVGSKKPLPIPLQNLNKGELCCIWAIGEVAIRPPSFKNLDSLSQHCIFCVSLMQRLLEVKMDATNASIQPASFMPMYESGRPMMLTKQSHSADPFGKETLTFDCVASTAILSALMSDSQAKLLHCCRCFQGEKFTWESARAIGMPYWVRSEKILMSVAEEIAQTVYKSTKSVMDCALYYVAMRNMKKLRAIAATDRSDQGKKFLKFIMDHDFSSERGRNAVEKNAYSLLRKRKYISAASFFLLAEPPMIKTALDVIKLQLQDFSLAFFIARLIESSPKSYSSQDGNLTIGGGFNLSSMGGGGGFASTQNTGDDGLDQEEDETVKFNSWEPMLGISARSALSTRDPPKGEDICFESLRLLWLGRPHESKLRLSHMTSNCGAENYDMAEDLSFPASFGDDKAAASPTTILNKANQIINFCTGPMLLKRMNPEKRVLWTSALHVSRALSRCGMEIPSIRILLQSADHLYQVEATAPFAQTAKTHVSSDPSSSIFDSYDAAPPKPKPAAQTKSEDDAMSFSIFDSYDAAPRKPKPAAPKPTQPDPMTSSIFDSFEVAPPKPKPTAPKSTQPDQMTSSIFDSYDAAPPKPKPAAPKPTQPDHPMTSSIFDSYDAAPPKPKPAAPKPTQPDHPMTSSIFDSYDAAPPKPKPAAPNPLQTVQIDNANSKAYSDPPLVVEKEQPFKIPPCPTLWNEWREQLIHVAAARRFIRELARIVSCFDCEPSDVAMKDFAGRGHPLIPNGAAEVLHNACDSEGLLNSITKSLSELSSSYDINESAILEQASELLSTKKNPRRIVFSVILQILLGRGDLAEDIVRDASSLQMNSSEFLGFSNDAIFDHRDTRYYSSSLWARRESSSVIWQLELCLWLHRGGAFEMSDIALKETLLAVRVGLAVVAWGRCQHSLEALIKAEPDCLMDFDTGKNLWRSMKIIVAKESTAGAIDGVSSGGWEFLVDCRRDEATEMLRDGKCGQFLIRPHPQDPGMFTLSFKTNLVPTEPIPPASYNESGSTEKPQETSTDNLTKVVKRDDVVQHAIIRLTDSGFRCGSFGPFATLVKLLHAVSDSLPFDLRFSDPPRKGVISKKGVQSSPNSFLFRKIALHSKAQTFQFQENITLPDAIPTFSAENDGSKADLKRRFGLFSQLLFSTELRKQLCAVAAALEVNPDAGVVSNDGREDLLPGFTVDDYFDGSLSDGSLLTDDEEVLGVASRMLKPFLNWVRSMEIDIVDEVIPLITQGRQYPMHKGLSIAQKASENESKLRSVTTSGDSMIRKMIQAGSGVDFRTLRVGEAGNSVIVVLFGKQDAIKWLMAHETGNNEADANERLKEMEQIRVIEPITFSDLSIPKSYAASHPSIESRYRFVDPWEVEALESRSGETASAALGRGRYQTLSVGLIASSCEKAVRSVGGVQLLGLWNTLKGGITLTKALCSAHPLWERDAGGDLLMNRGFLMEPTPYDNSIRQHLYGNYLFRRMELPQRFLALVQVELLDLKNVTSPSGSSSLTAFALLRLKREGSTAPLNHKARSLDSACTQARKISKSSGQNAPASWGSLVRFRFPLPEDVNCEGKSFDTDRESLFKGPPTCLQITVCEKKFMSEVELGGADVNLESLGSGGQIEEWVPLRAGKDGITWFARLRLSLRFELLCLDSNLDASETSKDKIDDRCPSVGLKKIQKLSRLGAHEDLKQGSKNSMSTPDLPHYFGNIMGV